VPENDAENEEEEREGGSGDLQPNPNRIFREKPAGNSFFHLKQ